LACRPGETSKRCVSSEKKQSTLNILFDHRIYNENLSTHHIAFTLHDFDYRDIRVRMHSTSYPRHREDAGHLKIEHCSRFDLDACAENSTGTS
jgi:hypothetical protein